MRIRNKFIRFQCLVPPAELPDVFVYQQTWQNKSAFFSVFLNRILINITEILNGGLNHDLNSAIYCTSVTMVM